MKSTLRSTALFCIAASLSLLFGTTLTAQQKPSAGMMRFPDVSAEQIVFSYADDLWIVSRDGGVALPLASPAGAESNPRFSPDGKRLRSLATTMAALISIKFQLTAALPSE